MQLLIAIPARYASTRFPGKPLFPILGKPMVQRVYDIAIKAAAKYNNIDCVVATDDQRIMDFCKNNNIKSVMTSDQCRTGTDRIHEILTQLKHTPNFVVNLQGDNPLCPPWIISDIIDAYVKDQSIEVVTPCVKLTWQELDMLREHKKITPFSGTTALVDKNMRAIWFSKNILPAIRNEEKLKTTQPDFSPVLRHIGLYGYRIDILKKISALQDGYYEKYEELEQLRFLENGIKVNVVIIDYKGRESMSGVDSPQDIQKAEHLLTKYGEF